MMIKLFPNPPIITFQDFQIKKETWQNFETKETRKIERYINGYDKGLLKKNDKNDFWSLIFRNCREFGTEIKKRKGFFYYNFHFLPDNRSIRETFDYPISLAPVSLQTVFVTGFLFPQKKIRKINAGYYIKNGKQQISEEVIRCHFSPDDFPAILFNLGYYYTKTLLQQQKYGYNQIRKKLQLKDESLSEEWLPFLGLSLWYDRDNRIINPPLFSKAVLGYSRKDNGLLIRKSFSLPKGSVRIFDKEIRWQEKDINIFTDKKEDIVIYTPFLKNKELSYKRKWEDFQQLVGKGRINFLILTKGVGTNPRSYLVKIKEGEILMPPMGLIISLSKEYFKKNFKHQLKQRVKEFKDVEVKFKLDRQSLFEEEVNFAYGGFLPLIFKGEDFTDIPEKLENLMIEQGFFHPFSRQSQETPIDKPYAREPRAILVMTEDQKGREEYGYFCFSGRFEESIGVNLFETTRILKKILPNRKIKNVLHLDSGSAVKLLYLEKLNKIKILNLTAISKRSFTGEYDKNLYSLMSFSI